ncbi:putative GDP-fucose synthetase [Bradyrhizobium sp. ORS 285]|nr:putative GDP-fucose synthetase [Bradyrhizobium sp. ORS 285]
MADACVHLMQTYSQAKLVNIGTGEDISIADFARVVAATVGFEGRITYDTLRPDGTPRKLLDMSRRARLARDDVGGGGNREGLSGLPAGDWAGWRLTLRCRPAYARLGAGRGETRGTRCLSFPISRDTGAGLRRD